MKQDLFADHQIARRDASLEMRLAELDAAMRTIQDKTLLGELENIKRRMQRKTKRSGSMTSEARQRATATAKKQRRKSAESATSARQPWTSANDAAVLSEAVVDEALAKQLGRSICAVRQRRRRLLGTL